MHYPVRRPAPLALVTVLLAAIAAAHPRPAVSAPVDAAGDPDAPRYGMVVSHDVMVPMRDGVRLATDVYRPALDGVPVPGRFPVILERTPYDKTQSRWWIDYFVARGYVAVAQDVRGRFASEGVWRMLVDDGRDGYDTTAWIGEQPWCSCKIGTIGGSYPGGTQHALALAGAPHLAAMVPEYAVSNAGEFGMRYQGAFELRFFNWIFNIGAPHGSRAARDPATARALAAAGEHVRQYLDALPLRPGTTDLKLAPEYETWLVEALRHGGDDDFWRAMATDVVDHVDTYEDVPVLHLSGWYDSWAEQNADQNYALLAKTKHQQHLLMGPWTHGGEEETFAGEADFGPDSAIDLLALHLRWFDHWLRGSDNGVDREPPVRIFVMGGGDGHRTPDGRIFVGGHWRDEPAWPLARARATPYYLHADGLLSPQQPAAEAATSFRFDPHHPVPTIGGNISSHNAPESGESYPMRPGDDARLMEQGAWDQRCRASFWMCDDELPLSARNDVLVFQSAPLEQDMEVTGPLEVQIWASSTAPDTDFTAKLVDVYPPSPDFPAGVGLLVGDGIVRARFRAGADSPPALLRPGTIYPFTIRLYPTSLVFRKGHRIRVDVSSSNFPRFDVNPNTGEPLGDDRRSAVAINTVYHDAAHPSHIVLPVVAAPR